MNIPDIEPKEHYDQPETSRFREALKEEYLERGEVPPDPKTMPKISYLSLACSFDFETTTFIADDGTTGAFGYAWSSYVGVDHCNRGRSVEEFVDYLDNLSEYYELSDKGRRLQMYAHNLPFDLQLIRMHCEVSDLKGFYADKRKPFRLLLKNGIEFRDTRILSGVGKLSDLAGMLQETDIEKMMGDLDYGVSRHSGTPLTDTEQRYIDVDAKITVLFVDEQIKYYSMHNVDMTEKSKLSYNITTLPLTSTQAVRKFLRNKVLGGRFCSVDDNTGKRKKVKNSQVDDYLRLMNDLTLSHDDYISMNRLFRGGLTHASITATGVVVEDVTSLDLVSSYPSVMIYRRYPMEKFIKLADSMTLDQLYSYDLGKNGFHFTLIARGVRRKDNVDASIVSSSWCSTKKGGHLEKPSIDNGRVHGASSLSILCNEVDLAGLMAGYDFESIELNNVYHARKERLPKPIIEGLLELYKIKTEYKGRNSVKEMVLYNKAKALLNSSYGMMVMDIVRDLVDYNDHVWSKILKEDKSVEMISQDLEKENSSNNRFTYYPWGVWITSYARMNLIEIISKIGSSFIYSDTDSIKLTYFSYHKRVFDEFNENVVRNLDKACEELGIDPELTRPMDIKGNKRQLGIWEVDGVYSKFKTLGAKRYMYEDSKTGEIGLTVAGMKEEKTLEFFRENDPSVDGMFDQFAVGLEIPAEKSGLLTHTFRDHEQTGVITDINGVSQRVRTKSSIVLEPKTYKLTSNFEDELGAVIEMALSTTNIRQNIIEIDQ